ENDEDGWPPSGKARRPSGGGTFETPWSSRKRRSRSGGGNSGPPTAVKVAVGLVVALVMGFVGLGITGRLGVTSVEANEVAVRVNYLTGSETVITSPGYQFFVPLLTDIYKLDGTTQEYVMAGDSYRGTNVAPNLTVRAKDGSNFWFDELKIQYELIPGTAGEVLRDSGLGDNYKQEWIKAYARSVLRDEFGRYSAVDAADPTTYKAAPEQARLRMNEILEPHGVSVVRIITPNPQFDVRYETAIEERKEADQEVEELRARVQQLAQEREQRLAAVRKEKEVEMQELTGTLRKDLLAAEQEAIRLTKSADAYATERIAEGRAAEARLNAEAQGLVAKYTKEAEGIESRAKALEQRGEVVVREALVEKLLGVNFTLVPYSRDPAPERLEHSGSAGTLRPAQAAGGDR
ncbi:MAG: SPFH domain-containing protein, partial [Planctomycetota bacterium]